MLSAQKHWILCILIPTAAFITVPLQCKANIFFAVQYKCKSICNSLLKHKLQKNPHQREGKLETAVGWSCLVQRNICLKEKENVILKPWTIHTSAAPFVEAGLYLQGFSKFPLINWGQVITNSLYKMHRNRSATDLNSKVKHMQDSYWFPVSPSSPIYLFVGFSTWHHTFAVI